MQQDLPQSIRSVITLLNNVNELITISSKRKEAKDVMDALVIYAKSKNIGLPDEKILTFGARLFDARPITLTMLIMEIAKEVIKAERIKLAKESANAKKSALSAKKSV